MKILCTTSSFNTGFFPEDYTVVTNPYKRKLSEEEALELVKSYQPHGIIAGVEPITRRVMESSGNLKVISRCGVGLDSVDLVAAHDLNILVFNTPDMPVKPVGELTVTMIYSLTRNINTLNADIREGKWNKLTGGLVGEKTIGVIGCGRIGSYVAKLLSPTGAKIIGYDPVLKEHPYCKMVSFDQLIEDSDIITLHLPYTQENKDILNDGILKKTRPGCIIINNARGGLVDENALYELLKAGHLGGAGLDVFNSEPYKGPLTELKNVILTPHIGSSAGNSRIEMEKASVKNLVDGLNTYILHQ
jgi:D-3-phosphoglycerate dehydrogenase / 2-oxoglutarate reductase